VVKRGKGERSAVKRAREGRANRSEEGTIRKGEEQ